MKSLLEPPLPAGLGPKSRRRIPAPQPRRFKRILVPSDFSRPSLKAIPYALAISRHFGADVYLLHVTDVSQQPPPTLLTLPLVPQAEWNKRFMKRLQALVLKYRTDASMSALEPRAGIAYEEICEAGRDLKADLIVVATHGYTGYKRVLLGSTAEHVVQHSPCPVLVVGRHLSRWNGGIDLRARTGFELKKILVPTDFSQCSQAAFDCAVQLARDFKAELRLVHVINPHAYPCGDLYAALDPVQLLRETEYRSAKADALNGGKNQGPMFPASLSRFGGNSNLQRRKRRRRSYRYFHTRPNRVWPHSDRQRRGTRRALRALPGPRHSDATTTNSTHLA